MSNTISGPPPAKGIDNIIVDANASPVPSQTSLWVIVAIIAICILAVFIFILYRTYLWYGHNKESVVTTTQQTQTETYTQMPEVPAVSAPEAIATSV